MALVLPLVELVLLVAILSGLAALALSRRHPLRVLQGALGQATLLLLTALVLAPAGRAAVVWWALVLASALAVVVGLVRSRAGSPVRAPGEGVSWWRRSRDRLLTPPSRWSLGATAAVLLALLAVAVLAG